MTPTPTFIVISSDEEEEHDTHSHHTDSHAKANRRASTSTSTTPSPSPATITAGTSSSQRQPPTNDLSGVATGTHEKDGSNAPSPKDADISPQSQEGSVAEYSWPSSPPPPPPPPSVPIMDMASSLLSTSNTHNPEQNHQSEQVGQEQQQQEEEEEMQAPHFVPPRKSPHHYDYRQDQDVITSSALTQFVTARSPLMLPQRESSLQSSSNTESTLKRKDQRSHNEKAEPSKRAKTICSPPIPMKTPPVTPTRQLPRQHQQKLQFQIPSPFTTSSPTTMTAAAPSLTSNTTTPTPNPTTKTPSRPSTAPYLHPIPLPQRSRPWTSAMVADMAQTLQDSFPFAEFSAKHEKSPREVFEAFSAVVQMPLFEYSVKGLARAQMKKRFQEKIREYREKERDVRRGHRAEQKERGNREREQKGKGEEKEGGNGEEIPIIDLDGDGDGQGEDADENTTNWAAEKRKSPLGQVPMIRASDPKTAMPNMMSPSSSPPTERGSTPSKTTNASSSAKPTFKPLPPASTPTPTTQKRSRMRADAIAPTGPSNGAPPELELRDGIYVLKGAE